jgi:hypothetical protein
MTMRAVDSSPGIRPQGGVSALGLQAIQRFEKSLGVQLLAWALVNILAGGLLQGLRSAFWRAVGWQSMGWGAVNAAIALFGIRASQRLSEKTSLQRAVHLRRILWVNAGLDVLYVIGGAVLVGGGRQGGSKRKGTGVGILLQGGFLFLFDTVHAMGLRRSP